MAKKGEDPRKKVSNAHKTPVTPENTEKMKVKAGGYEKAARAINAPAGTKLAKPGTEMAAMQNKYAKEKLGGNASSLNRASREAAIARKLESESTFRNKAYATMSKKFNK